MISRELGSHTLAEIPKQYDEICQFLQKRTTVWKFKNFFHVLLPVLIDHPNDHLCFFISNAT